MLSCLGRWLLASPVPITHVTLPTTGRNSSLFLLRDSGHVLWLVLTKRMQWKRCCVNFRPRTYQAWQLPLLSWKPATILQGSSSFTYRIMKVTWRRETTGRRTNPVSWPPALAHHQPTAATGETNRRTTQWPHCMVLIIAVWSHEHPAGGYMAIWSDATMSIGSATLRETT